MRRRVLLASVLLSVIVLGIAAFAAQPSIASTSSNCTYYSNASHTTVVGQFGKDCCNNPVAWGQKTKYSVCGGCFVCLPPPR